MYNNLLILWHKVKFIHLYQNFSHLERDWTMFGVFSVYKIMFISKSNNSAINMLIYFVSLIHSVSTSYRDIC